MKKTTKSKNKKEKIFSNYSQDIFYYCDSDSDLEFNFFDEISLNKTIKKGD